MAGRKLDNGGLVDVYCKIAKGHVPVAMDDGVMMVTRAGTPVFEGTCYIKQCPMLKRRVMVMFYNGQPVRCICY